MSMNFKNKSLIIATVFLIGDYGCRSITALKFHNAGAEVNGIVMIILGLIALFSYVFRFPILASHMYALLGICIVADLIVMVVFHAFRSYTLPYLFAHAALGCFYLGSYSECLTDTKRKH